MAEFTVGPNLSLTCTVIRLTPLLFDDPLLAPLATMGMVAELARLMLHTGRTLARDYNREVKPASPETCANCASLPLPHLPIHSTLLVDNRKENASLNLLVKTFI